MRLSKLTTVLVLLGLSVPAHAETVTTTHGGDSFVAGDAVVQTLNAPGDAFVAARNTIAHGVVGGDLHVTGFDVSVSTDTRADLYAFGAMVAIKAKTAEDLTVAGFAVRTEATSDTLGNARLLGNTVTIEGPVQGALSVFGREVILNAPIAGDARITAHTITFGPDAVIEGVLTYSTEQEISVPERVAPAARVRFERLEAGATWEEMAENWDVRDWPVLPTAASLVGGFVVSVLFFVALGALMLGLAPNRVEALRAEISDAPGRSVLLGVVGLSILFGLVPITGMTVIGLPFVPIVLLAIVVAWILGYALGVYAIAMRLWAAFGGADDPSKLSRLVILAAAIAVVAVLNFIPFVGWVANYTLVLLGIGAITSVLIPKLIGSPDDDAMPLET